MEFLSRWLFPGCESEEQEPKRASALDEDNSSTPSSPLPSPLPSPPSPPAFSPSTPPPKPRKRARPRPRKQGASTTPIASSKKRQRSPSPPPPPAKPPHTGPPPLTKNLRAQEQGAERVMYRANAQIEEVQVIDPFANTTTHMLRVVMRKNKRSTITEEYTLLERERVLPALGAAMRESLALELPTPPESAAAAGGDGSVVVSSHTILKVAAFMPALYWNAIHHKLVRIE